MELDLECGLIEMDILIMDNKNVYGLQEWI